MYILMWFPPLDIFMTCAFLHCIFLCAFLDYFHGFLPEHMVVDADRVPLVEQSGDAPEDEGKHAAKEFSLKIHKFKKWWNIGI